MPTLDDLLNGRWHEYPKGSPALSADEVAARRALVPDWQLTRDGKGLRVSRRLRSFAAAIELVNRVAEMAEAEQHHPDIRIHGYRNLELDLWTHSVGGLTDNDFIMAAKSEKAYRDQHSVEQRQ